MIGDLEVIPRVARKGERPYLRHRAALNLHHRVRGYVVAVDDHGVRGLGRGEVESQKLGIDGRVGRAPGRAGIAVGQIRGSARERGGATPAVAYGEVRSPAGLSPDGRLPDGLPPAGGLGRSGPPPLPGFTEWKVEVCRGFGLGFALAVPMFGSAGLSPRSAKNLAT